MTILRDKGANYKRCGGEMCLMGNQVLRSRIPNAVFFPIPLGNVLSQLQKSKLTSHKQLKELLLTTIKLQNTCNIYELPLCSSEAVLLTSHGEDARWWWLAVWWHWRYPEGRGWLSDWGHGQAGRGHNRWGWERNHAWQIDIIDDERVIAVVKWAKVTTDTKPFFCVRRRNKCHKIAFSNTVFMYLFQKSRTL